MRKIWALAALAAGIGFSGMASAATLQSGSGTANQPNAGTITIGPGGSATVVAPSGTYDGVEDVAYNVINNSGATLQGIRVTGTGIAGFDTDGIDNYASSNGASLGVYGAVHNGGVDPGDYSGFSDNGHAGFAANLYSVNNLNSVDVFLNGTNGLAAGGTGFISFEAPGGIGAVTVGQVAPLPASVWAGLCLLGMVGALKLSKRASFGF